MSGVVPAESENVEGETFDLIQTTKEFFERLQQEFPEISKDILWQAAWAYALDIMRGFEMIQERESVDKERESKEKEQTEKEKTMLPSLVKDCVDWARKKGMKKLTVADVDAFLAEKELELLYKTNRVLYAMVNVELKAGLK